MSPEELEAYVRQAGGGADDDSDLSSYISSAAPKDQAQADKIFELGKAANEEQRAAKAASKPGAIFKETVKDLGTKAKQYGKDSEKTVYNVINAVKNPKQAANKAAKIFTDEYEAGINKAGKGLANLYYDEGGAKKVAAAAEIVTGTAQALFSSITGLFHLAQKIPGLKQASDAVNLPFLGFDKGTRFATDKFIYALPDNIVSDEAKEILVAPLSDLTSLASQILLGNKIMEGVNSLVSKKQTIGPAQAEAVVANARKLVVKGGGDINEVTFSNKYTPEAELPTIDWGKKPVETRTDLPTIQVGEKTYNVTGKKTNGELTIVPIEETVAPKSKPQTAKPKTQVKDTPESTPVENIPVTRVQPEMRTSKLAADIENSLNVELGTLPEYRAMNMADQANRALRLIDESPDVAFEVAMGRRAAPNGLKEGSVFTALRERAKTAGDVETLMQLAKSDLASEASKLGQKIKAFDTFRDPHDPVYAMQEVMNSRVRALEKKTGQSPEQLKQKEMDTALQSVKEQTKKGVTEKTWSEFIETIRCNY